MDMNYQKAMKAVCVLLLTALPPSATLLAAPPAPRDKKPAPARATALPKVAEPKAAQPNAPEPPPVPYNQTDERRKAVQKNIALLQRSATVFSKRSGPACVSCHHSLLPVMTLAVARERGVPVDEKAASLQHKLIDSMLKNVRPGLDQSATDPGADQSMDSGDIPFMAAYILSGFAAEKQAPNATTDAIARYLLRKQLPDGRYPAFGVRAPMEGNTYTTTALAIRGLQVYASEKDAETLSTVRDKARSWFLSAKPRTNEDRAFRLLGLKWTHADPEAIARASQELLETQNDDGGWPQLPYQLLSSDAYATGQALVALHEGGGIPTSDVVYQRGVNFLTGSQQPDGSWLVTKRCHPVVPYFDGGYPGGKNQFISFAGSCWADMAISLSLPAKTDTVKEAKIASAKVRE